MRVTTSTFHQGAQTSFAPESQAAVKQMGAGGHALFQAVLQRVRATVEDDFGVGPLYSAGSLLTRIWAEDLVPHDGMDVEPGHRYDLPHVDKANRASYDYSALLYLNSHCHGGAHCTYRGHPGRPVPDFDGGRFAWLGADSDVVVEPRAGRLVTFTGGLENAHHGRRVTNGTRFVVGFWFTCHLQMAYRDDDDDDHHHHDHHHHHGSAEGGEWAEGGGGGVGVRTELEGRQRRQGGGDDAVAAAAAAVAAAAAAVRMPAARMGATASEETDAPPVPPRKSRPSQRSTPQAPAAEADAHLPAAGNRPPPVPPRKRRPSHAAPPKEEEANPNPNRNQNPNPHPHPHPNPHAASPEVEEAAIGGGAAREQCRAASPSARAAVAEAAAATRAAPSALGRLLDQSDPLLGHVAGEPPTTTTEPRAGTPEAAVRGRRPRYVDGIDLEAASAASLDGTPADHRVRPVASSPWRGYDLPGFPDGVAAPFEHGYEGSYGLDDDATMEEAIEAFAAALERYSA